MTSFYENNHSEYFEATAPLDPSPFLTPLAKRLPPGATILDVGCGSGRDLRWLANQGFKPTGFELSPSLAKLAEDFSGQPVIQGDFTTYDSATSTTRSAVSEKPSMISALMKTLLLYSPPITVTCSGKKGCGIKCPFLRNRHGCRWLYPLPEAPG